MGAVYRALGRFDQSRAAYDAALDGSTPGTCGPGTTWHLLLDGLGDTEGATRAFLAAMDLGPGHGMSAALLDELTTAVAR